MSANKDFEKKFKRRFSTLGRIGGKLYDLLTLNFESFLDKRTCDIKRFERMIGELEEREREMKTLLVRNFARNEGELDYDIQKLNNDIAQKKIEAKGFKENGDEEIALELAEQIVFLKEQLNECNSIKEEMEEERKDMEVDIEYVSRQVEKFKIRLQTLKIQGRSYSARMKSSNRNFDMSFDTKDIEEAMSMATTKMGRKNQASKYELEATRKFKDKEKTKRKNRDKALGTGAYSEEARKLLEDI